MAILAGTDVRDSRWAGRLKRFLSASIHEAVVDSYQRMAQPTINLNQFDPEDRAPDDRLALSGGMATTGAGNAPAWCIFNPPVAGGSPGVLGIVESILLTQLTLQSNVSLFYVTTALVGTLSNSYFRDTRMMPTISTATLNTTTLQVISALNLTGAAPAGSSASFGLFPMVINAPLLLPWSFPLVPGSGLLLIWTTVGVQTAAAMFDWRERLLPAG